MLKVGFVVNLRNEPHLNNNSLQLNLDDKYFYSRKAIYSILFIIIIYEVGLIINLIY